MQGKFSKPGESHSNWERQILDECAGDLRISLRIVLPDGGDEPLIKLVEDYL